MTQNYQQYQSQSGNQEGGHDEDFHSGDGGIDEDDPQFDALLRAININEIQTEAAHQHNLPLAHKVFTNPPEHHSLGLMNIICQHCQALHLDVERLKRSTQNNKKFGLCYLQGLVLPCLALGISNKMDITQDGLL